MICRQKKRETGPGVSFWNFKVHSQWHISFNKITPIPIRTHPLILLKQFYQLVTKHSNMWADGVGKAFSQTNSVTASLSNVSCFCDKNDFRVREFPLAQLEDTVHCCSTKGAGCVPATRLPTPWWGNHGDCILRQSHCPCSQQAERECLHSTLFLLFLMTKISVQAMALLTVSQFFSLQPY